MLSYREFRSLRLTDRNGLPLRTVLSDREGTSAWTPLDEISPYLSEATIAAEDKRFFRHPGVDPFAISRAVRQNIRSRRVVAGGSTLTQQFVRIVRDYPRNLPGKVAEAAEAVLFELVTSKKEVLAHYLNRAPYGNQSFGIAAAAGIYFDKPPAHLSLAESAFLAGLPQSPTRFDPYRHPRRARKRQRWVLKRMLATGRIDRRDFELASREPLALVPKERRFQAPHFADWVLSRLPHNKRGRLSVVRTSLDLPLQQELEKMVSTHVRTLKRAGIGNGSAVVLDNHTGEVLAMVGSADYFDEATAGQVNGALAPRPPGSTWKPFTYALAVERGMTAASIIADIPLHAMTMSGDFTPRNYDERFHGPVRLRTALACSYNIPAVRVLEQVGVEVLLNRLRRAGFRFLTRPASHYGLGLTLGGAEASLLQLARAYSALANDGMYSEEKTVLSSAIAPGPAEPVFLPAVAHVITDILSDDDARAPAFGAYSALSFPFPCAVKTGTSKNFRDSWTIGYTKDYTVGIWLGNFDGTPSKGLTGASAAAPLFRNVMMHLHRSRRPDAFGEPVGLAKEHICPRSGHKASPTCPTTITEKFVPGTAPHETCGVHQLVEIDSRNGLLARDTCEPQWVEKGLFEVYPPIYSTWSIEHDVPIPPLRYSPLCVDDGKEEPAAVRQARSVRVTYPDAGDVFVRDPVLRSEFQTLLLTPEVSHGADMVEWIVDGESFAKVSAPYTARWPLAPGRHRIKVRARIGGKWMTGAPIAITVL